MTSTPETVRGVDLAKVDLIAIDAALKASGVGRPRSATIADRVLLMADHEAQAIGGDKDKGGACDHCGGISLLSRPCCPYCGTGEEGMPPAPVGGAKPKPAVPSPGKLAKTGGSAITPANVEELDSVTRRLKGLIADTMSSHWKLGRELTEVMKVGVYKYRVKNGVPVHASFSAYCKAELGLTPEYARSLMAVAELFTEQQVRDIGVTKLKFMARVPEETRGELLPKAAELPKREVEKQVQQLMGGKKPPRRKPRTVAQPTRAVAPNEATAVIVPERFEARFAPAKPGELPRATFELQNGLQLVLELTEDAEGLVTIIEFKRVVEAEAAQ